MDFAKKSFKKAPDQKLCLEKVKVKGACQMRIDSQVKCRCGL